MPVGGRTTIITWQTGGSRTALVEYRVATPPVHPAATAIVAAAEAGLAEPAEARPKTRPPEPG